METPRFFAQTIRGLENFPAGAFQLLLTKGNIRTNGQNMYKYARILLCLCTFPKTTAKKSRVMHLCRFSTRICTYYTEMGISTEKGLCTITEANEQKIFFDCLGILCTENLRTMNWFRRCLLVSFQV